MSDAKRFVLCLFGIMNFVLGFNIYLWLWLGARFRGKWLFSEILVQSYAIPFIVPISFSFLHLSLGVILVLIHSRE